MFPKFFFVLALLVGFTVCQDLSIKEEIIQDGEDSWVDPTDMFEWRPSKARDDPVLEKVERLGNIVGSVRPLSTRERNECREQRKELSVCQRKLRELQLLRHLVDDGGDEPCMDREFIYLRRLALNLVNKTLIVKVRPKSKRLCRRRYQLARHPSWIRCHPLGSKVSDNFCNGVENLEAILFRILNRLEDPVEQIRTQSATSSEYEGVFGNANSFWLVPLLAIAGTIICNSVYNTVKPNRRLRERET